MALRTKKTVYLIYSYQFDGYLANEAESHVFSGYVSHPKDGTCIAYGTEVDAITFCQTNELSFCTVISHSIETDNKFFLIVGDKAFLGKFSRTRLDLGPNVLCNLTIAEATSNQQAATKLKTFFGTLDHLFEIPKEIDVDALQ